MIEATEIRGLSNLIARSEHHFFKLTRVKD